MLRRLWNSTLNSVLFGIALMVLVALYIAIGSGVPSVREAFEMNELQFFSAWPLKGLMVLLVANLATVTWTRIPFTPPRYGVWTIHAGIIVLIAGMSFYYNRKVEGLTRVWTDPRMGPNTVDSFYDSAERSLYVRTGQDWTLTPLPTLPRFKAYENLDRADLKNIRPSFRRRDAAGREAEVPLKDQLGLKDDVSIDLTGYWPYANINTRYSEDPSGTGGTPAIKLTIPHGEGAAAEEGWIVSSDARENAQTIENNEIQHLNMPDASAVEALRTASTRVHQITAKVGGKEIPLAVDPDGKQIPLAVEVGKSSPLGDSGYTITIETFNPAWPMSGTGEIVKALTLMVKSPAGVQYRRMILAGKDLQTDFKLDDPTGGPMGKRQKEPLDKDLVLLYRFSDPFRLLPQRGSIKHLLVTSNDSPAIADISAGLSQPASFQKFDSGSGELKLEAGEINAPFLKAMGALPESEKHPPLTVKLAFKRHVLREDSVDVVPPVKRDRNFAEMGVFQVVRAKVKCGPTWSREVLVPFGQDPAETRWEGGSLELPDGTQLQLQIGNTRLQLPAKITLRKFELVPYKGGDADTNSMMRDFRSTLAVQDPRTGAEYTAVAHMNNPVYFGGGAWLFFQAQFDPQQRYTVLGVGNRPGVLMMLTGFAMIVVGLMYAFYLKPLIIRRMKQNALAAALAKKPPTRKSAEELVGSA